VSFLKYEYGEASAVYRTPVAAISSPLQTKQLLVTGSTLTILEARANVDFSLVVQKGNTTCELFAPFPNRSRSTFELGHYSSFLGGLHFREAIILLK
jgi:hypothetical protein